MHNEGPAIPARDQATLFEPYRRAQGTSDREGWGLGLTFVRSCALAHGGSITVESRDGFGTTFTLRLPWDASPSQAAPAARGPGLRRSAG